MQSQHLHKFITTFAQSVVPQLSISCVTRPPVLRLHRCASVRAPPQGTAHSTELLRRVPLTVRSSSAGYGSLWVPLSDKFEDSEEWPHTAPVQRLPPQTGEVAGKKGRTRPLLQAHQVQFGSRPRPLDALGMDIWVHRIQEVLLERK